MWYSLFCKNVMWPKLENKTETYLMPSLSSVNDYQRAVLAERKGVKNALFLLRKYGYVRETQTSERSS